MNIQYFKLPVANDAISTVLLFFSTRYEAKINIFAVSFVRWRGV